MKLGFCGQIMKKKNTPISNFIKIRPVGAELFHADGQTDMTNVLAALRNFADAPKRFKNFSHTVCLHITLRLSQTQ